MHFKNLQLGALIMLVVLFCLIVGLVMFNFYPKHVEAEILKSDITIEKPFQEF